MTHFKEAIETLKLTTGLSKEEIATALGIRRSTFALWMNQGPPQNKLPKVRSVLRSLITKQKNTRTVFNYKQLKKQKYKDIEIAKMWDMHPTSMYQWKIRNGIKTNPTRGLTVVQIDPETNEIIGKYRSAREAAKQLFMSNVTILNSCHGVTKKNCSGYVFRFVEVS